jgi:dephospho-CoA kinase
MIFIGVTGGIGSGKSTVCSLFEQKGIPVFYADAVAKVIAEGEALSEIVTEFGPEILSGPRVLDRMKLGSIVFNDPSKLEILNSIIHPRVFDAFEQWKSTLPAATKYALVEAALMFESGMFELLHYVLGVLADDQIRIARVVSRDSVTEEQVKARIRNQISLEQLLELSDFQINNNSAPSDLTPKINFFHTIFSNLQPPKEIE